MSEIRCQLGQQSGWIITPHRPLLQTMYAECMPLWHNKDKSENPCGATGWLVCPYSFSTKNDPKMGSAEGGEKPGLHLKDKFFQTAREAKMGAWGITVRQSDDGLDLLDTIVAGQLRKVDFSAFNVSEAIVLLNQTIQEEIEQYRQKPPSKITDSYISETLMHNFTNAAILVAECLYDYYQTGELVVYDYVGENYDSIEHHIKNFIVTGNDLPPLLAELESVQSPEHWKYQEWASEQILRQWLEHIRSVQQSLEKNL